MRTHSHTATNNYFCVFQKSQHNKKRCITVHKLKLHVLYMTESSAIRTVMCHDNNRIQPVKTSYRLHIPHHTTPYNTGSLLPNAKASSASNVHIHRLSSGRITQLELAINLVAVDSCRRSHINARRFKQAFSCTVYLLFHLSEVLDVGSMQQQFTLIVLFGL